MPRQALGILKLAWFNTGTPGNSLPATGHPQPIFHHQTRAPQPMKPQQSLPKVARCGAALLTLLAWGASAQAQGVVFKDTFGNAAGRVSSTYVPSGFTYAATGDVVDNYYTIAAPTSLGPPSTPGQTWWDKVADHTGDTGGAVLVVNAGNVLSDMYQRDFTVLPGHSYRISAWRWIVNGVGGAGGRGPLSWDLQMRDPSNNTVKVHSGDIASTGIKQWLETTYEFTVPVDCKTVGQGVPARMALVNRTAETNGNDFYVDDVSVTDITPNDALDKFCPAPPPPAAVPTLDLAGLGLLGLLSAGLGALGLRRRKQGQ